MNEQALNSLVAKGLGALHAGGQAAQRAQDAIRESASHPELKSALEEGQQVAETWRRRVDEARTALSASGEGPDDNPVIEAHFEEAKRIREQAPDDASRDLGIVAAGQQALHYWIASFGTMGTYLKALGKEDLAASMSECVDEARRADEGHTAIAGKLLDS